MSYPIPPVQHTLINKVVLRFPGVLPGGGSHPGGCLLAATGRGQHFGNQHGRVPGRRGSRERGQEPPISKVSRPLSRKLFGCLEPGPWPNILMITLIHSEFIAVCSHGRVMIRTEDWNSTLIASGWFRPARAR